MTENQVANSTSGNEVEEPTYAQLSSLTPAEQAVLDEALSGLPAREIAERLSLTEATVRSHLSHIYLKLGVSGRVALLASFRESEPIASDERVPSASHVPRGRRLPVAAALLAVVAAALVFAASVAAIGGMLDMRARLADPFRPVTVEATAPTGRVIGNATPALRGADSQGGTLVRSPFAQDASGLDSEPGVGAAALTMLPYAVVLLGLGFVAARLTQGLARRR